MYSPYPDYKNSCVDWLGKIPRHWHRVPIKRRARLVNGSTPKSGVASYWDGNISWVTPADMSKSNTPYITNGNRSITKEGLSSCGTSLVPKNAIIMSSRAPIGLLAISSNELCTNQGCKSIITNSLTNSKFLYYVLLSSTKQLNLLGRGTTFLELSTDHLGGYQFATPELEEQTQIAAFLDRETAKIDQLIEKQQQLIKLLQEKRQAVISHAVTKGLNPYVPMKDSGVEWLGEVPEHWKVKRLKYISPKIGVGLVINPSTYTKDEGVYFIFGADVKEFSFDLSKTRKIDPKDSDKLLPSRLNALDLVSIRVGYPGITAVVTNELNGANCASVIIIRKGNFISDWLCAAMNSWIGKHQVSFVSYGAAQKQYNVSDAVEFKFPTPPISEQVEIAVHIKSTLNKFGELNSKIRRQIGLLKEQKTALISAAVTGKIDVRNHAPLDSNKTTTTM